MTADLAWDRLLTDLADGDVTARQQAADIIRTKAFSGVGFSHLYARLKPALSDPDETVRLSIALALIRQSGLPLFQDALPAILRALDAGEAIRSRAMACVLAAALDMQDIGLASRDLVWVLVSGLDSDDTRRRALSALSYAAAAGADISPAMDGLMGSISSGGDEAWVAAAALGAAQRAGVDIDPAVECLRAKLGHEDKYLAYHASGALAAHHLARLDDDGLLSLLRHSSHVVREGAAHSLAHAASQVQLSAALPALILGLQDEASGVASECLDSLNAAARRGLDVEPALPALQAAFNRPTYSESPGHWALREWLDLDHRSETSWNPAIVSAMVVTRQYINSGKLDEIERLMRTGQNLKLGAYLEMGEAIKTTQDEALKQRLKALIASKFS